MSTYIVKQTGFSGQVIMNINNVDLPNDPVLSYTLSSTLNLDMNPTSLAVWDKFLIIGYGDNDTVSIWDLTNSSLIKTINGNPNSGFGSSISVKDKILAVGSPNEGTVSLFLYINDTWKDSPNHIITQTPSSKFGSTVHINEKYIIVSSPLDTVSSNQTSLVYVYFYNYVTDILVEETVLKSSIPSLNNNFGHCIESLGGDMIIVSSPKGKVNSGSTVSSGFVEIFKKTNSWNFDSLIHSPSPLEGSNFGYSIDVQIGRMVIGEPGANQVHIFDFHYPNWILFKTINSQYIGLDNTGGDEGFTVSQDVSKRSVVWSSPSTNKVFLSETTPRGNIVGSITSTISNDKSTLMGEFLNYNESRLIISWKENDKVSIGIYLST